MFKVIIKKRIAFQGRLEEFSNVYVLSTGIAETFGDEAAIDSIVALEKTVHAGPVTFFKGETYGINPVTGDVPRFGKDLSGGGSMAAGAQIYNEAAILVTFELPRKGGLIGIGRRRMLRKWLHTGYLPVGAASESNAGAVDLGATAKGVILNNYANPLRTAEHGGGKIAAPNGDLPTASAVRPYLEHHQFHAGKKHKHGPF
jgi:hypothetical protein